jgi:cation diffusion facilitator family transporter
MASQQMPDPKPSPPEISRSERRAVLLSLAIGILLLNVKFVAYSLTRSNVILSDALENIANVLGASFAFYAITLAHRGADKEHPYGHGKIEFFAAGLEGAMILLAAVVIVGKVALSWRGAQSPDHQALGVALWLIASALVLNGVVGLFLWQRGRQHDSLTLQADGLHLLSDAVTSALVLGALFIERRTGWHWVDNAAALIAAAYIIYLGIRLIRRSTAGLMDRQDAGDQTLLRRILDSHIGPEGKEPQICSYHKVRHRHNGRYHWVDFHIMVPAWWDIEKGHQVASSIEYEIEQALGEANATAHVEPCVDMQCPHCESKKVAV